MNNIVKTFRRRVRITHISALSLKRGCPSSPVRPVLLYSVREHEFILSARVERRIGDVTGSGAPCFGARLSGASYSGFPCSGAPCSGAPMLRRPLLRCPWRRPPVLATPPSIILLFSRLLRNSTVRVENRRIWIRVYSPQ